MISRPVFATVTIASLFAAAVTLPMSGCAMTDALEVSAFLPPPPVVESAVDADETAWLRGKELREGERLQEASFDSQKVSARWIEAMMTPVLGREINKTATPALHALIKSSLKAAKHVSRGAKGRFYGRLRPFAVHPEDETCNREVRDDLNAKASYPSGHTTAVWTVGLALSAAIPEKAGAILDRAYRAGDNRWICGHHWKSDVDAGRALASATYAKLSADPDFQAKLRAAREEFAQSN